MQLGRVALPLREHGIDQVVGASHVASLLLVAFHPGVAGRGNGGGELVQVIAGDAALSRAGLRLGRWLRPGFRPGLAAAAGRLPCPAAARRLATFLTSPPAWFGCHVSRRGCAWAGRKSYVAA